MVAEALVWAVTLAVVAVTHQRSELAGLLVGVKTQMGAELKAALNVWLAEVAAASEMVPATSPLAAL